MVLQLYFGQVLVGTVMDPFYSDETWGGSFNQAVSSETGQRERLYKFIAFCKGWHVRLDASENPDASEFAQFGDLLKSDLWYTMSGDARRLVLDGAPVFYDDQISWRTFVKPRGWGVLSDLVFDE